MKIPLAVILVFLTSQLISAQIHTSPKQSFKLSGDTLYWDVPAYQVKSHFIFHSLESNSKLRLRFSEENPLNITFKDKEQSLTLSSPDHLERTVIPLNVTQGDSSKVINVTFVPPFHPRFSERYINKKKGAFHFTNAPVYELVNIVFSLTDKGSQDAGTFNLNTEYCIIQNTSPDRIDEQGLPSRKS